MKVAFVHRGYSDYLELAIRQVLKSCPEVEVVLLGDSKNRVLSNLVTHCNILDFESRATEFKEKYIHLSLSSVDFELFCIQRWLVLSEWAKSQSSDQAFFALDSDVLIYSNLLELEEQNLRNIDFTICRKWGPQFSYFKNFNVSIELANWIEDSYKIDSEMLKRMRAIFEDFKSAGLTAGGVSDMYLLQEFSKKLGPRSKDLGTLDTHPYFDENFSQDYGFLMENGKKVVFWEKKIPKYRKNDDGTLIQVGGIHFQGGEKVSMRKYYTGSPFYFTKRYCQERIGKRFRFVLVSVKRALRRMFFRG